MTLELPISLEKLQSELEQHVPEYSYQIKSYLFGKTVVAKKSNFSGAEIRLTKKQLKVSYAVPSVWGNALVTNLGLVGVLLARWLTKDALVPRNHLSEYLKTRYAPVKKQV